MPRRARWAAALLLACLALAACGKKGPVVAPERRLPQAPADLKASVEEDALVLTWHNPTARVDNSRLRDLSLLRLHRRDVAEGVEPKPALLSRGQVVGYDEVAQIRLDSPAPAVIQGGTTRWEDRKGLGVNKRYVYVVTAEDSLSRSSPPSERLVTYFLAPPRAPRGVSVTAGDHQATIRWEAPTELTDGGPTTGELRFVILRGPGGEGPLAPVTPSPVAGTTYTDTGLENDTEYRWAVRAVRMDPRAQATGP
ncbi:MAG TPA: fibronectin type III domain-containing protein, partial [Methylomirabilota bacterium]|nr:fibronectin type III domain-containing protein [Methylomirabilota bacterium]